MHWKIARDPYLRPLCEKHGEDAAIAAGFFFDEDADDAPLDDVDWLSTPLPKRAAVGPRPVVLLATGGFCPVHDGHLAMMEGARAAALAAGLDVIGGYLSPGHDDYLRLKCGPAAVPAWERLRQCADAVAASDWLSVDPWEAMHRRVSVNYTDVAARLRAYLRAHVDPRIDVAYVCGADNARFAYAFTEDGMCIVVGRPNAESEGAAWRERLGTHPRVLWAPGDHPAASRAIRAKEWIAPPRRKVVLRVEDERAVRTLGLSGADYAAFVAALHAILEEHIDVRIVSVAEQEAALGADRDRAISLDPMIPAKDRLAVSRAFALGGWEQRGHVARPGAPPLAAQVGALAPGRYVLVDDDLMTGGTIAAVRALLPPDVVIERTRFAIERAPDEDVVDARDFLLGADEGGLVTMLPGGALGRAIYALPYVDPAARASVNASHAFSSAVWALNARALGKRGLFLRDLPMPARLVLALFAPHTPLEDVCRFHEDRLARVTSRRA